MNRFSSLSRPAALATLSLALATPAVRAADPFYTCPAQAPQPSGTEVGGKCSLDFRGSTTLRPISDRARFVLQALTGMKSRARALGSTTGTRALIEGTCAARGIAVAACDIDGNGTLDVAPDIAQSSRAMNSGERTRAAANLIFVNEVTVAKDGLAIIVNPNVASGNPGFSLTQADVNNIYTNPAATDWNAFGFTGGTIHPVSRTPEGGTYGSFLDLYICSTAGQTCPTNPVNNVRAPASPPFRTTGIAPVLFVGSNDEVLAYVESTPGAVGYVGIAFLRPTIKNTPVRKTLANPAVAATFQTVQDGTFAFGRSLFNYVVGVPEAGSCRGIYLDYLMSRQGQANVVEAGYVPAYGNLGFDSATTTDVRSAVQTLLEPIAGEILDADNDRADEKLEVIAAAEAVLATNPTDVNALTDKSESEVSLREMVEEDSKLVDAVIARAVTCIGACNGKHCQQADRDLQQANDARSQAADAVIAEDYHGFLKALGEALEAAQRGLGGTSRK